MGKLLLFAMAKINFYFALIVSLAVNVLGGTFSGKYSDPNHPGCARVISLETDVSAKVFGADAAGGEGVQCDGVTDVKWGPLPAVINSLEIVVDFSSKGGPSNLAGKFNTDKQEIMWQDGNAWVKLSEMQL